MSSPAEELNKSQDATIISTSIGSGAGATQGETVPKPEASKASQEKITYSS